MYSVKRVIDLLGWSLCEVHKCVITVSFYTRETNKKKSTYLLKKI